jgi:hypothetical protein
MNNIKDLLERYYNGETSLEEEQWIRNYLARHPQEADATDRLLFSGLEALKAEAPAAVQQKTRRIPWRYLAIGSSALAAGFALLIGLRQQSESPQPVIAQTIGRTILVNPGVSGEINDEALALEQARKALAFVSSKLNKGTAGIGQLNHLEKSIITIQNKEEL